MTTQIIIFSAFMLLSFFACQNKKHNERPHVIIIQPDQHRGSVMGCAGDEVVKTNDPMLEASREICTN